MLQHDQQIWLLVHRSAFNILLRPTEDIPSILEQLKENNRLILSNTRQFRVMQHFIQIPCKYIKDKDMSYIWLTNDSRRLLIKMITEIK